MKRLQYESFRHPSELLAFVNLYEIQKEDIFLITQSEHMFILWYFK